MDDPSDEDSMPEAAMLRFSEIAVSATSRPGAPGFLAFRQGLVLARENWMTLYSNPLTQHIIGCALDVHRALGPGLLESTYRKCLTHRLLETGVELATEVPIPVRYRGIIIDCGYRADIIVDNAVLLELKSVDRLLPVHQAQVLTYLKLSGIRQGLLMNFNVPLLKDGIKSLLWTPSSDEPGLAPGRARSQSPFTVKAVET